jgi:hypothetical protein
VRSAPHFFAGVSNFDRSLPAQILSKVALVENDFAELRLRSSPSPLPSLTAVSKGARFVLVICQLGGHNLRYGF